jgi:peptidoglycan/LPS O-acetylase OafA/YrhL
MTQSLLGCDGLKTRSVNVYWPEVDGLRAVAVSLVVLFHSGLCGKLFSGGFIGVDVFFVISGYLITKGIQDNLVSDRFSFIDFYYRRVRRIAPAYLFMMCAVVVFAYILIPPTELANFAKTIASSSVFYSNIQLYHNSGYFSDDAKFNPLLHTWSLSVEEQFYLIWPACAFLVFKLSRQFFRDFLLFCVAGMIVSLVWSEILTRSDIPAAFYLPMSRAWELLLGAIVCNPIVKNLIGAVSTKTINIAIIVGLASVLTAALSFGPFTPIPGLNALLPCIGSVLILIASARTSFTGIALRNPPLVAIGRISYSLYLWHWPVFVFLRYYFDSNLPIAAALGGIVLSVILATISWKYVETPARRIPAAKLSPQYVILAGIAGAMFFVAIGTLGYVTRGFAWRGNPTSPALAIAMNAQQRFMESPCLNSKALLKTDHASQCNLGAYAPAARYEAVLWGDSHAAQFAPAIAAWGKSNHVLISQRTRAGCAPLPGWGIWPPHEGHSKCSESNLAVLDEIERNPRIKLVVLSARWESHFNGHDRVSPDGQIVSIGAARENVIAALHQTLIKLFSRNVVVVLLGPVPLLPYNLTDCINRSLFLRRSADHCARFEADEAKQVDADVTRALLAAVDDKSNLVLIRPFTTLCDQSLCTTIDHNGLLFLDSNHLSPAGASRVLAELSGVAALDRLIFVRRLDH